MKDELTIIKLGGALLTDKSTPYTAREPIFGAVAREIKECIDSGLIQSLILLHGVGSYGHPPVLEHKLHKGFQQPEQRLLLSKAFLIVNKLRFMLVKELQEAGLPVFMMYSSSMATAEKMKMKHYFLDALKGWLEVGMIPVIGGDMLPDMAMGWSVGSADQLGVVLSRSLGANKLIFATDVAGIYEGDPKISPNAPLIAKVNLDEFEETLAKMGAGHNDASGAMKGKLKALVPAKDLVERGLEVSIISMMAPGHLKALLKGDKVPATLITSQ
ncbi:MAG: isopentenyl phosphate kinase [Candidatus Heimdallarchaeota archaeon]